mgnify:CR=1 FL=1|jgi:hypothetical protein
MAVKTFTTGSSPLLEITADANLMISGWAQENVEAQVRTEDLLTAELLEDKLRLYAEEDLVLKVPVNAQLQISLVEGSLTIASVMGEINIQSVGGHLNFQATGPVTCGNVSGHCKFTGTTGDLRIHNIGGNLKGSSAVGTLSVSNVGGNIKLLDVLLVQKVHAGGNIKAKFPASPNELEALAGGNIKLWVPADANFNLEAHSGGEKVVLQTGNEPLRYATGRHRTSVGAGGPLVRLHAGGNVYILNSGWEEDLVAEDFVPAEEPSRDWTSSLINDRIERRIQSKIRAAEARANAASRRAEVKMEQAMRKMDRFNMPNMEDFWPKTGSGAAANTPPAPRAKVSDEERMIVLNMLSEKKITAEEANQLLDALNGKFGK